MSDLKNTKDRKNSDSESDSDDDDDNGFSTFTPVPIQARVRTAAQINEEAEIVSSSLAAVAVAIRQQREDSDRRRKEEQQKRTQPVCCCMNASSCWSVYTAWLVVCGLICVFVFGCGILTVGSIAPYVDRLPGWLSRKRDPNPSGLFQPLWSELMNAFVCTLENSLLPAFDFVCVCINLCIVGVSAMTLWKTPEPPGMEFMISKISPGYSPIKDVALKKSTSEWWTPIRGGAVGTLCLWIFVAEYLRSSNYQYNPQKYYCPSSKISDIAASLDQTEKDGALKMADEIETLSAGHPLIAVNHDITASNLSVATNISTPLTNSTLPISAISPNAKVMEAVNVIIEERKPLTSNAVSCLVSTATDIYLVSRLPLVEKHTMLFDIVTVGANTFRCYTNVLRAYYRDPLYERGRMDDLEWPLKIARIARHGYGGYTHWSETTIESIKTFVLSIPEKARKAFGVMKKIYQSIRGSAREFAKNYASKRPHLSKPDLPWYVQWASSF